MNRPISINKHEYNQRMVLELNEEILKLEQELNETTGFTNVLKKKLRLRKLYKRISLHGKETLEFERINNSQ